MKTSPKGNRGISTETPTIDQELCSGNCVIYTRAKSEEQSNIQLKICQEYCRSNNLIPIKSFENIIKIGPGYHGDARVFSELIEFVKTASNDIRFVVVSSLDRFGRCGSNAIKLVHDLKSKYNISVIAANFPFPDSAGAELIKSITLIFAKYDNELRREKIIAGIKKRIESGLPSGRVPLGYYSSKSKSSEYKYFINESGYIIKKGFELKLKGLTNEKISSHMKTAGLNVSPKRLSDIFRNPFYAGYIKNALLNGKIVKGQHPPLFPLDQFLKLGKTTKGFKPSGDINKPEPPGLEK